MIRVTGMDHIVLRVSDVERSLAFYMGKLGLAPDRVDLWRRGEIRFPSVRLDEGTIIDLVHVNDPAAAGAGNLDHYCLVVDAARIDDVADELRADGVEVVEGPVKRAGAKGDGMSIYLRDPDGNKVELRTYAQVPAPSTKQPVGAATT